MTYPIVYTIATAKKDFAICQVVPMIVDVMAVTVIWNNAVAIVNVKREVVRWIIVSTIVGV